MRKFMVLFSFSGEAVGRFLQNPSDRAEVVRKLAAGIGGELGVVLLDVWSVRWPGHHHCADSRICGSALTRGDGDWRVQAVRDARADPGRRPHPDQPARAGTPVQLSGARSDELTARDSHRSFWARFQDRRTPPHFLPGRRGISYDRAVKLGAFSHLPSTAFYPASPA